MELNFSKSYLMELLDGVQSLVRKYSVYLMELLDGAQILVRKYSVYLMELLAGVQILVRVLLAGAPASSHSCKYFSKVYLQELLAGVRSLVRKLTFLTEDVRPRSGGACFQFFFKI